MTPRANMRFGNVLLAVAFLLAVLWAFAAAR
jgi:hypothetical protein